MTRWRWTHQILVCTFNRWTSAMIQPRTPGPSRSVASPLRRFRSCGGIRHSSRRIVVDDYGERRMQAFVYGGGKPYVEVYTIRGDAPWIISFRRARESERDCMNRGRLIRSWSTTTARNGLQRISPARGQCMRPIRHPEAWRERVAAADRRARSSQGPYGLSLGAGRCGRHPRKRARLNARVEKVLREALAQGKL